MVELLFFRFDNNIATSLHTVSGLTFSTGDVWSFAAIGADLVLYKNQVYIGSWPDATYTTGVPGFSEVVVSGALNQVQVSAWRGYNAIQQDGIWQKQGVILQPVAADINTGITSFNSGTNDSYVLANEPGIVLSGTVFAAWFWSQQGVLYAESFDGITWTRKPGIVVAGAYPKVIKNAGIYYLFTQPNANSATAISVYTSTDKITWTLRSASALTNGAAGQWDQTGLYLFSPVDVVAGTFRALYTGLNGNAYAAGLATSTDGITWTKYAGNPVINNIFTESPILVNGKYYLWAPVAPPGEIAGFPNPTQGQRLYSSDLITWTKDSVSIRMTELTEGVNTTLGAAYPNCLVQVGNQVYLYYNQTTQNQASNTGAIWQVSLATVPATLSRLVGFKEDAVLQLGTDNFQRTSMGSNWTTPTGGTALQIASNLVEPTAISTSCAQAYTASIFSSNQYSEVTTSTIANANSAVAAAVRMQLGANSYYMGGSAGPTGSLNSNSASIFKNINGVFTQIGPSSPCTPQVGDVWRLSVVTGSDGYPLLTLYQNGWLILQVTDYANSLSSGYPGIRLIAGLAVTDAQISSWAGGNTNTLPVYNNASVQAYNGLSQLNPLFQLDQI